jgi:DNA invertase Pin-like site-specific DNA recombinase
MRTIIYARVSTRGGKQEFSNQLLQLRKYCDYKDYEVVEEIVDEQSVADKD